jgi:hypothetical protein
MIGSRRIANQDGELLMFDDDAGRRRRGGGENDRNP